MSVLLPPGLAWLVRARIRAAVRDGAARARTVSGALAMIATVVFLAAWLVPVFVFPMQGRPFSADTLATVGPVGLLVVWFGQVAVRGGGEVLGFMPSEADNLFAAPYTPAEVLRYKVALLLFAWTLGGLLLSPMAMFYAYHPLGGFLAVLLVLPFLQLSAMCAAMLRRGGRMRIPARIAFFAVLVGLAVAALRVGPTERDAAWGALAGLQHHPVGGTLLLPFTSGVGLLVGSSVPELLAHAAVVLAVDVVLVAALLWLGRTAWLEIAAEGAAHMHEKIQQYRSGGGVSALGGWWNTRVPAFPRAGGVGIIAWRRAVEIVRRPATFAALGGVVALVLGLGLVLPVVVPRADARVGALVMLVAGLAWGNMITPSMLRLDFRADLDRMDVLIGLPLQPRAVFVGQVLPMTALVTVLVWCLVAISVAWSPAIAPVTLPVLVAQPFFAYSVVATENAVFLWFPVRTEAGEAAVNSVGRNLMNSMVGWTTAGLTLALAVGAALPVVVVTGSVLLGALAAVVPCLATGGLATWVGSRRFGRFDPSIHVPR